MSNQTTTDQFFAGIEMSVRSLFTVMTKSTGAKRGYKTMPKKRGHDVRNGLGLMYRL